jgi:hypothetical protein
VLSLILFSFNFLGLLNTHSFSTVLMTLLTHDGVVKNCPFLYLDLVKKLSLS